eukprot:356129-Chlamydomonas_euryale.AAC.1
MPTPTPVAMRACLYTSAHTRRNAPTHARSHARTLVRTHTRAHARTCCHTDARVHACARARCHTNAATLMHSCVHTGGARRAVVRDRGDPRRAGGGHLWRSRAPADPRHQHHQRRAAAEV